MKFNVKPPSRELYQMIMAAFVMQGSSLSSWCKENNVARSNVVAALTGSWNGPKAKILRAKVIEAAGIGGEEHVAN
ncbi:hypothetical protein OPW41_08815 [Vibrio europaeus]|uniref:hypothetical protein n=1 Tax=Vibrio europaeus TaxID=300876 RepID=UPI00233EDA30|nr:hypothetical protein [Vibrio europaeus]MDC5755208.1 hypothetical protein [Vibrio europaeus]MDC5775787.1 hypothetical protein [Vibrio europaeus]MDC5794925.1 hypothetical protein [Vibrio europaeus]MDC5799496.1 hypothetical protein [Vibrio europaeus]MDC5817204.1 hypothetical protein [Vibrio europaeus]